MLDQKFKKEPSWLNHKLFNYMKLKLKVEKKFSLLEMSTAGCSHVWAKNQKKHKAFHSYQET